MDLVEEKIQDGVAIWTISRPPVNAMSMELLENLSDRVAAASAHDEVRAVVVTGAGPTFVAGADIQGFMKLGGKLEDFMRKGREVFQQLEEGPKPLVAAVNGIAYGGGNELAMACDVRIASPKARFGQPEVHLGIIPGWGGTVRLPRLVGAGHARRLLMTGDPIDADTAYRIGLIEYIVPEDLLVEAAINMADKLASLPPLALRAIKALLAQPGEGAFERETEAVLKLTATADAAEGVMAFLGKRRPRFQGR